MDVDPAWRPATNRGGGLSVVRSPPRLDGGVSRHGADRTHRKREARASLPRIRPIMHGRTSSKSWPRNVLRSRFGVRYRESHVELAPNNPTYAAPGHSSAGPAGLAKRSSPPSPPAPRPLAAVADTGDGERTPCALRCRTPWSSHPPSRNMNSPRPRDARTRLPRWPGCAQPRTARDIRRQLPPWGTRSPSPAGSAAKGR